LSIDIHLLSEADFDQIDEMMKAAYKVSFSRRRELERYLSFQPKSHPLVASNDGELVGFGAALNYGPFAYIGLMAVSPKSQRRGVGGTILGRLLEWLDGIGCPTVLLDASYAGEPLYAKNGFTALDQTHVLRQTRKLELSRHVGSSIINVFSPEELSEICSFDAPFFGVDRKSLLRSYFGEFPSRTLLSRSNDHQINGFIVAQKRSLGPWVASDPIVAEGLLSRAMEFTFDEAPTVVVSALNEACLNLLFKNGFEITRSNRHMYKGKLVQRARSTAIYGQATMGFG